MVVGSACWDTSGGAPGSEQRDNGGGNDCNAHRSSPFAHWLRRTFSFLRTPFFFVVPARFLVAARFLPRFLARFFFGARSGSFAAPVSRFHSSKVSGEILPFTSSSANLRRCALLLNGIADH